MARTYTFKRYSGQLIVDSRFMYKYKSDDLSSEIVKMIDELKLICEHDEIKLEIGNPYKLDWPPETEGGKPTCQFRVDFWVSGNKRENDFYYAVNSVYPTYLKRL